MPIKEMIQLHQTGSEERIMAMQLAMHCTPLLKGIKIANLLTVKVQNIGIVKELLKGTNISYRILKKDNTSAIMYLYRISKLQNYFKQKTIRKFLENYGYINMNLEEMFEYLSDRIMLYQNRETEFPHEIGIFLGYPLGDVKSYLDNNGRNCSYVGYWKVYHNVSATKKLFKKYDEEREAVMMDIISGKSISEIAV